MHNFGIRPAGDIAQIDAESIPDHDILFAGFPCQPFSIIGSQGGMEDDRGTLIYEIIRILQAKRPPAFILENVRQLSTFRKGRTCKLMLRRLEELGYECRWNILNALDYGLPQKRERMIIVGFKKSNEIEFFDWPKPKGSYRPLAEILERNPHPRHFVSARIREKRHKSHTAKSFPSVWHENKGGNIGSHSFSCALRAGASYNYLLVNGERRLTPREQLRLQGFPERFEIIGNDSQIRKQTGNAVPVPIVRAVLRKVLYAATANSRRVRTARAITSVLSNDRSDREVNFYINYRARREEYAHISKALHR